MLTHNTTNAATGGIWRVTEASGASSIVKVAAPPDGTVPADLPPAVAAAWTSSDDPGHWNYWRREALAYETGLAASVYADQGLRPPHLIDLTTLAGGSVAMRLEDVDGRAGGAWTLGEWCEFATRLGAAQARWLGEPMPYPWCSRGWLRQFVVTRPVPTTVDWNDDRLASVWPAPLRAALGGLWARRVALIDRVERLPQTLAHLDVWPANLIWSDSGPVLLDWSFVGGGAMGEDIGNLVFDAFADGLVDIALMPAVIDAVITGYAVGARRDLAEVRRAVGTAAAAKYCWFGPRIADRFVTSGGAGSVVYDVGGSPEDVMIRWRPLLTQLIAFADDALTD
jgi:hypothetical protein